MRKEDLRLRVWYGEGYYSGASATHVLAYDINDKELLEKHCEVFNQKKRYIGDLDGKYSEVPAQVQENDLDDFIEILKEYENADMDIFANDWEMPETQEEKQVEQAFDKAYDFINNFELKEVYRNKETGEILDMSLYEKEVIAVEK